MAYPPAAYGNVRKTSLYRVSNHFGGLNVEAIVSQLILQAKFSIK